MGDGPQDDKTEVMREVPSKAPGTEDPAGKAGATADAGAAADSEATTETQAPVDGSTEVLGQVPARDTSGDSTKVLRQVPAPGQKVDSPTAAAAPASPPAASASSAGQGGGQAGPASSESTTQVVEAVPPKNAPPEDASAAADAKAAGDAKAGEGAKPGPEADGPTAVMGSVAPKPDPAASKPAGGPVPGGSDDAPTVAVPAARPGGSAVEATQGPEPAPAVASAPARPVEDSGTSAVSDAKAEPDGKAGLDAKADADGESVSGGGEKVVAGAAAVAAAAVTTDAKAATEPDAASDTESDAEPDTKSAAQPAADSEAPTGEHAAPAGPSTDADAAAGQREQVADEDPPAEQPASEAPAAAEAAEAPAAEVPAAEAPAAEAPAAEVPAAEAPAAEAPATAAEAPANAEAAAPSPAPPRATPVRIEPTPGRWPASEPPTPRRDKRKLVLAGAALVVLLGLGGWVLTLAHGSLKNVPEIIAPTPPKVTLAYQPGDGTTPVSPTTPVSVTATDGVLREVALTVAGGTPIKGELSPDRRTWTVSQPLAYGKTYTWAGTASDVDDPAKTVPIAGTVTTVKPKKTIRGTINIGDGRVVGIAAPIEIQFNGHVTDRASVERALKVDTSVPTVGGWAWFQDEGGGSRIRWRPQSYWQPGTKVTVTAPMFGVDYGAGSWGAANISTSFTIGRSQITKADVNSHQLVVYRDGRQVFNFPASYGLGSDPNRNTRNGIHVVSEKFTDKRMVNPRYGYDVMEKFAVRISNNGEFIHANPQTVGVQGSRNITHGCVNLSLANAKQYFDSAMYGDPVEVTGSPIPLSARDGDIWDWTLDWDQWTRLSALNGS